MFRSKLYNILIDGNIWPSMRGPFGCGGFFFFLSKTRPAICLGFILVVSTLLAPSLLRAADPRILTGADWPPILGQMGKSPAPQGLHHLLIGERLILGAAAGGILVLTGFGLGLGAMLLTGRRRRRLSKKFAAPEEKAPPADASAAADPPVETSPAEGMIFPLHTALKAIEDRVAGLDDLFRRMENQMTTEPVAEGEERPAESETAAQPPARPNPPRTEAEPLDGAETPPYNDLNLQARARYLRNLGGQFMNDGDLIAAEANFSQSLAIMKKLAQRDKDNQARLRDLVLAYHNQGRVWELMGDLDRSRRYFEQSLELTSILAKRAPDNFDWLRGLAASHSHLGRVMAAGGNLRAAGRHLKKDVEVMRNLVERRPENKSWQYALAGSLHNLSVVREQAGLIEEALEGYRQEAGLMHQLIKDEPNNRQFAENLASLYGQIGRLLQNMDRLDEALYASGQYLESIRGLIRRHDPDDAALRRELSVALSQVGRLHELNGNYDQALNHFDSALEIRKELADGAPECTSRQCDLAAGLCKIGDVHFACGRRDKAIQWYNETLRVVESLESRHGPNGPWMIEKCGILLRIGNHYRSDDAASALEFYNQALALAVPRAADEKKPQWRKLEAIIRKNMGR